MRHHDWPERLAEYIESVREEPFVYGSHDCCQFAGKGVEAITGENPAAKWTYGSETGAKRFIAKAGGLDKLLIEALGDPIHVSSAGRGDVVVAELENGLTVGLCLGRVIVFAAEPLGLMFMPREAATMAWRI
jgi:hypothetical protein